MSDAQGDEGQRAREAAALLAAADQLMEANALGEALAMFDQLIDEYGHHLGGEPSLQIQLAQALRSKLGVVTQLGEYDEIDGIVDEALTQLATVTDSASVACLAEVLLAAANSLLRVKRYERALTVADAIEPLVNQLPAPDSYRLAASKDLLRGRALARAGHFTDAIAAFGMVVDRGAGNADADLALTSMAARLGIARTLEKLGEPDGALEVLTRLAAETNGDIPRAAQTYVAAASAMKARLLQATGRPERAIEERDLMLRRIATFRHGEFVRQTMDARLENGRDLLTLGRASDALAVLDALQADLRDASRDGLDIVRAECERLRAQCLEATGDLANALAANVDLVATYGQRDSTYDIVVARAMVAISILRRRQGQYSAATDAAEIVLQRVGAATGVLYRDVIANALVSKIVSLIMLGRVEESLATIGGLVERYRHESDRVIAVGIGRSLIFAGDICIERELPDIARRLFDVVAERCTNTADRDEHDIWVEAKLSRDVIDALAGDVTPLRGELERIRASGVAAAKPFENLMLRGQRHQQPYRSGFVVAGALSQILTLYATDRASDARALATALRAEWTMTPSMRALVEEFVES